MFCSSRDAAGHGSCLLARSHDRQGLLGNTGGKGKYVRGYATGSSLQLCVNDAALHLLPGATSNNSREPASTRWECLAMQGIAHGVASATGCSRCCCQPPVKVASPGNTTAARYEALVWNQLFGITDARSSGTYGQQGARHRQPGT